jgi:8-oxo-dGTP pyrophosphatase MutT (NUDIX family)
MNYYSGVLIITVEGEILLQQRDNKPGIVNPGFVTTFGGLNKDGESPLQGAIRELTEETNLIIKTSDLKFFRHFYKTETDGTKTKVNIFILRNVSKEKLEIYEGKSYYPIRKDDNLDKINLSSTAKKVLQAYFKEN